MAASIGIKSPRSGLAHDFVLPTLLFTTLGAMSWAVRGSAGASSMNAHVAPGLMWGAAWWFVARDPSRCQSRRYASGWILFALTVGFALAGNRGWMQWHHLYEGHLSTNYPKGEWEPIPPFYGFLWFFLAGSAWAGLPACFLAWCSDERPTRAWEWTLRIACGLGGAYLASRFFVRYPEIFLPKYSSISDKYHNLQAYPGLVKMIRDNGATVRHLGYCLGFLMFEALRRDWKNVTLISTVGILNGLGWSFLQNWKWAAHVWPEARYNWGRCWEVCAGISIGIGLGIAYYLVNRQETADRRAARERRLSSTFPHGQWLLAAGLLALLGFTAFWPAVADLRRPSTTIFQPQPVWGAICFFTAAASVFVAFAHRSLSRKTLKEGINPRRTIQSLESWMGLALMLVLGWFIRNEVVAGFGDGVRDASIRPDWLSGVDLSHFNESARATLHRLSELTSAGNIYFGLVAAYCLVRFWQAIARNGTNGRGTQIDFSQPALDDRFGWEGLVIYLGFTLILIAAIGPNLTTTWPAPLCFALAAAAFGVGYAVLSSRSPSADGGDQLETSRNPQDARMTVEDPNLVRWGVFLGMVYGLGLSLRKLLKGGAHLYFQDYGDEKYWDPVCWKWVALGMLVCLLAGLVWFLSRRVPRSYRGDLFPHASAIMWLVLIAENIVAQVVTGPVFGPHARWDDFQFNLLYLILFALTAAIIYHFQFIKRHWLLREAAT